VPDAPQITEKAVEAAVAAALTAISAATDSSALKAARTAHSGEASALAGFNAARLARLAVGRDGLDAADERLGFAREHVDQADLDGLVELRLAEAHVALAHGRRDEALQLAEEACAAVGDTESLTYRAEAAALRAAILDEEPAEAVELYERKGNVAAAARLRALVTAKAPR